MIFINDCNDSDPRLVWDAYKAYMWGVIISYSSKKRKERTQESSRIKKKKKKLEEDFHRSESDGVLKELKTTVDQFNKKESWVW